MPPQRIRAAYEWEQAVNELGRAYGDFTRAKEAETRIDDQVLQEFRGVAPRPGDEATLAKFEARRLELLKAEAARVRQDADTEGTFENGLRKQRSDKSAQRMVDAMHKANLEEIDLAARELQDLERKGRITPADVAAVDDIARTSKDSGETADRLHDLLSKKDVKARETTVQKPAAANDTASDLSTLKAQWAEAVKAGDTAGAAALNDRIVAAKKGAVPIASEKIRPEWSAFAPETGTKGIPRADMPQIKAEHRGAMVNFLAARGITHEQDAEVDAASLKPTQAEFSPAKVEKAKKYDGGERSILVSSDGHVLDGHHQWLAKREAGEKVKVIRLDAPIERLLAEVREFPSAEASRGATAPQPNAAAPVSTQAPAQAGATVAAAPASPPKAEDFADAAAYYAAMREYRAANPTPPAPAPERDRRSEIKRKLASLQDRYEKRMKRDDRMAPPAIKADALSNLTRQMDKLDAELKALDEPPAPKRTLKDAQDERKAKTEADPQPFEHAGLKVYPTKIRVAGELVDRWAVQLPENKATGKVGGDTLHTTVDEAKKAAEYEAKRAADRAEFERKDAEAAAERAAKVEANRGKSIKERFADAVLDKPTKLPPAAGLGTGTRREAMQMAVEQGRAVVEKQVEDTAAKNADKRAVDAVSKAGYLLGLSNENIPVVKAGLAARDRLKANKYEKPEYRVYGGRLAEGPFYEITKVEFEYAQSLKERVEATRQKPAEQQTAEPAPADPVVEKPNPRDRDSGEGGVAPTQDSGGAAPVATHKDPGEPAEAVTPAVVEDAIKTAVSKTDRKPSEMKADLLAQIDAALLEAPDYNDFQAAVKSMGVKDATSAFTDARGTLGEKGAPTGYSRPKRTFKVEGDGVFTVQNSVRQLLTFRANVNASKGFADRQAPTGLRERATDALDRRSKDAAIANMIDEGDMQAATDYAEAAGVALADVKLPKILRERLDKWQKDRESDARMAEWKKAQDEGKPAPGSLAAMIADKEAEPAPAPAPEPDAAEGVASQTFDQWVRAKYDGNEYKDKYLEEFGGDEKRAMLGAAVSTIDNDRTTAELLKAARIKYSGELLALPRETSISLDVWDALDNTMKLEAQRHFYDIDSRITRRTQEETRARVKAEAEKKAPYEAAFAEVDAEIRRLDKLPGPVTKRQNELSARRDRLREAIYQIGQGKEPDGRLLKKDAEPQPPAPQAPAAEPAPEPAYFATIRNQARAYWDSTAIPAIRDYLRAFDAFGADRLERNNIKPKGMSAREWLESFVTRQSTWDKGRKTGTTGIQYLSTKDLWPTDDGAGERLRKSALAAVKALKGASMTTGELMAEAFMEPKTAAEPAPPPAAQEAAPKTLKERVEATKTEPATAPMPPIASIPTDLARQAHAGTSHVPEVRAQQERESFQGILRDAWARAARVAGNDAAAIERITEVFKDVADGYYARYTATLSARSRVMSSMIAGPARFPVERNRKRMETERKRADEAQQYLERGIKRLIRAARGPIDNSPESELERVRLNLTQREEAQEQMKAANVALRKGDDEALRDLGFTDEQIAGLKKPDFAGRKGFPDYKLTNNNAEIRRLRERLKDAESRKEAADAGPVEAEFNGVKMVEDATDDRLRLLFDGKPSEAVREDLKANGFRWSPKNEAWQRQLTDNARRAAKDVLTKHYAPKDGDTKFSRYPGYNREPNEASGDVAAAWKMLAENDDLFSFPKSDAKDLADIADEVVPNLTVTPADSVPSDVQAAWYVYPPNKPETLENRGFVIHYKDGKVEVNVSKFNEGDSGSQVYAIAGNYAFNNGLEFTGDRMGITDVAVQRRLENMISLALKFGTTDFISPHPDMLDKLGMQWKPGDSDANLQAMLMASYENAVSKAPALKDVVYDPRTGNLQSQSLGVELSDRDAERVIADARASGLPIGRRTLSRLGVTQAVAESEVGEGRRRLLEGIGQRARGPVESLGVLNSALYSRPGYGREPIARRDTDAVIANIRKAFPRAPDIVVHDTMDTAPKALRDSIAAVNGENDVEAAYHAGKIHVFPANIASLERMEFVVGRHELRHAGLDAMLGKGKDALMDDLYAKNANLREAANLKLDRGLAQSRVEAVEEALADMPVDAVESLTGFDRLVAAIRTALRMLAGKLRGMGLRSIGNAIDPKGWTDKDLAALVQKAEDMSRADFAGTGLVFSRAPKTDSEAFRKWFGDSKVVDANGEPMRVYHATPSSFDSFKPGGNNPLVSGAAIWATPNAQDQPAAHNIRMVPGEPNRAYGSRSGKFTPGTNVMPLYMSVKNPLVSNDADWKRVYADTDGGSPWILYPEAIAKIKAMGHDGAFHYDKTGALVEVIAFNPEQVKSATGNSGAFDPANPDIRFSRAGTMGAISQQAVRNSVNDFFGSAGAKVSWWDKHLGTQYAKAEKFPQFKRVFERVQSYIEDVSTLANEAADSAPSILPKLETWKDLQRSFKEYGLSAEDAKAVAGPIFDGTLTDKKVYADSELASRFNMTPQQIGQYREFLATVNTSLDQLVTADVLRLLGDKNPGLRELAVSDRNAFRVGVVGFLTEQADAGNAEAVKLLADVSKKYDHIDRMKSEGYAPLMRFGRYLVNITDPATGESKFFGLYETKADANRMFRELSGDPQFAGMPVRQGMLSEEQYKLFSAVPVESLEMFAEALGADKSEVFQDFIRLAKNNRSAMKRLIERKGTAGFSEDVPRVLASFVTSNSRMAAGSMNLTAAKDAINEIRDGDVKDEAIKLVEAVQNPTEKASGARALMFMNFIGGSIASAVVNLTQPITMTLPYLSQFGGMKKAGARLMAAGKDAASGNIADPTLSAALKRAEADGIVSPQEIHSLQAQAMGSWGTNPLSKQLAFIWSAPFSLAEQFNRRVTFIAAYRTAMEEGRADPFGFAEQAVIETQGLYNPGNAPNLGRTALGATALQFKQFSIHYLEWMGRMYRSGPEGKRAVLYALAMLMVAAGTDGLPFADDLDDLVDTLGQALGYDTNSKKIRREFVARTLGLGDENADIVARGLSAMPGFPMDVSLRMGLGNLIPATGIMLRSNTDRSRDLLELAGPAGGLAKQYMDAGQKVLAGDLSGAAIGAAPVALQNVAKAAEMWATGEARDTLGRKVMDVDATDGVMKFLGFNPQAIARESQKMGMIRRSEQLAKNVESDIAGRWARGIADGDTEAVKEAIQELADWNRDNPEDPIRITTAQVVQRVRKLRQTREQRFITSVSPERRAAVTDTLQ